jgi:hypothetical protein
VAGCAERLGDIDKTDPRPRLQKDALQGDWYYRQMITDIEAVASEAHDGIIGYASSLRRVRWDITRDWLLAISLEEVKPGANDVGENRPLEEVIVARYPITQHYDVRREYDAQTGEENNVVYEDTSSRKWYEREYIQVNWAANEAVNFLDLTAYWPEGSQMLERSAADDDSKYLLDISPDHINVTTDEHITTLVPGQWGYEDVATSKYTIFTSALRVAGRPAYQPLDYPSVVKKRDANGDLVVENGDVQTVDVFERYGFFQTVRQNYDRFDGEVWNTRDYFIERYNLWEDTFNADGSVKPVQERKLKPILYFLAEDYPAEMVPAAHQIGIIWNEAFRKALKDVGYPVTDETVAFAVCDNPVTASSSKACMTAGAGLKLFGDLRYNFLKLARPKGTVNPLGFGPNSPDPATGEAINGWAVTYYAGLNNYSKYALDMVKMFNGEVDEQSIEWLDGDYFEGMQQSFEMDPDSFAASRERAQAIDEMRWSAARNPEMQQDIRALAKKLNHGVEGHSLTDLIAQRDAHGQLAAFGDSERDEFEGFLPSVLRPEHDGGAMDAFRGNPARTAIDKLVAQEKWLRKMSDNCVYVQEFADPTIAYLARRVAQQYPYPAQNAPNRDALVAEIDKKILVALRDAIYIAVQLHEVGHNLGLRHNFAGSSDMLNYIQPGVSSLHVSPEVFAGSANQVNEGFWTIATQDGDRDDRLEYQYSSIMDYGASFMASDIHGVGAYDISALRFGYLGYLEAFSGKHPEAAMYDSIQGGAQTWGQVRAAQFEARKNVTYVPWDAQGIGTRKVSVMGGQYEIPLEVIKSGTQELFVNRHKFCTDTWADFWYLDCSRWDVGMDDFEVNELYRERAQEAYWFTNYRRGKVQGGWGFYWGLIDSLWQRYFFFATRAGILASYYNEAYGWTTTDWLREYQFPIHQVAAMAMNDLIGVLMTPDTGNYGWSTEDGEPFLTKVSDGPVEITNHDGAHPRYSEYQQTKDEEWHVSRYGYFNNKLAALLALTIGIGGTNLEHIVVTDQLSGFGSLSLAAAFPGESADVLKSLVLGTPSRYSALPMRGQAVAGSGTVQYVMPSNRMYYDLGLATESEFIADEEDAVRGNYPTWDALPKVDHSPTGYEFQYSYLFYSWFLPSVLDSSWTRYLRINKQGDLFSIDWADPARVVTWEDEGTGIVWEAYDYDDVPRVDGTLVDPSIGATYLTYVKDALDNAEDDATRVNLLGYFRYQLDFMYNFQSL